MARFDDEVKESCRCMYPNENSEVLDNYFLAMITYIICGHLFVIETGQFLCGHGVHLQVSDEAAVHICLLYRLTLTHTPKHKQGWKCYSI